MKCPCGNQNDYAACCGPIIEGTAPAPNPEALMRSRYTAYTQANTDYIAASQSGPAAKDFDPAASKRWAEQLNWQNLAVFNSELHDNVGFVCFKASFVYNNKTGFIFEKSEFRKIDGSWYYYGSAEIKRNDPCPCNSGKKYKKCCIE